MQESADLHAIQLPHSVQKGSADLLPKSIQNAFPKHSYYGVKALGEPLATTHYHLSPTTFLLSLIISPRPCCYLVHIQHNGWDGRPNYCNIIFGGSYTKGKLKMTLTMTDNVFYLSLIHISEPTRPKR